MQGLSAENWRKCANDFLVLGGQDIHHKSECTILNLTDGVNDLVEQFHLRWLLLQIDETVAKFALEEFIVLEVSRVTQEDKKFALTFSDGNGSIFHVKINPSFDFPYDKIRLYIENETICLPSDR